MKSLWFASASVFLFCVAPACAPDATSSNKPIPVCEEGTDGCPSVPRAEKRTPSSTSNGPSSAGWPATPTGTTEEELKGAAIDDAGADAAADAALGALCTALAKCCGQIEEAGYTPDNCKSVVALKHEGACYAQHQQYKNAGDCS